MRSVMFFFLHEQNETCKANNTHFSLKGCRLFDRSFTIVFDSFESHSPSSNMKNGKYRKNERK